MTAPPRLWPAVLLVLGSFAALAQTTPDPTATPTPTPRPRLSGGFGRTPLAREAEPTEARGSDEAPGHAYSDVVKAASDTKAKKESKATGSISITNQTLVTNPSKGKLTTYSTTRVPTPEPAAERTTPAGEAPAKGAQAGDETYWRQTAHAARARVEELKIKIAELDAASKRMENDFYNWDDGQYRDRVIKPAWDKTKQELDTATQELERAEKDLADLPDRARKAGALPGWLRE